MNIQIIIILISCVDIAMQQRRLLKNSLQPTANFFYKIHSKIHSITNKLLSSLKSDNNFTKSNDYQMLLTNYYSFNNISERNYKSYAEIKKLSIVNFDISHKNNILELLQEIVKEAINILQNNVMKVTNKTNKSKLSNILITKNNTDNSQENFVEILSDFSEKTIEMMIGMIINENMGSNAQKISYSTIKDNETNNSLERFKEIWSMLNDKATENIEDPIKSERKSPDSTAAMPVSDNNSHQLETWHLEIRNRTRRIYKGRRTKIKNYPFVASLHLMSEFLCAGSIISMDMVLTAASCLQIAFKNKQYHPRTIFVRLGSDQIRRSGKLIPVTEVIFHPKYDHMTLKHNLAIVKMLKKIKNKKNRIEKIKYETNAGVFPRSVKEITILGWGARDETEKPKDLLRLTMAHLDIYDSKDCKEVYSKYYVTNTNFCAGSTFKGSGACTGDVGGPAVVAEELVGVISFGPTVCGMPDAPTVFTKVGYYAQWIDEVLKKKPTKKKLTIKTTTREASNIFVIPLYTTASRTKHSVSPQFYKRDRNTEESHTARSIPHTKSAPKLGKFTKRAQKQQPEEIDILKKLISEFILGNHTVIDYLTNAEIDDEDRESFSENISENKEKLFLDVEEYSPTTVARANLPEDRVNVTNMYMLSKYFKNNYESMSHLLKVKDFLRKRSTMSHLTKTTHPQTYDVKPTKLPVYNREILDVISSDLDLKSLLTDDSSSYYELDIPIEDSPFRNKSSLRTEIKTNNKQIDFFERNLETTTTRSTSTELIIRSIAKPTNSIKTHHKEISDPVDHKNRETTYEVGQYHKYHTSKSEPKDDENPNESENKEHVLKTSDSGDTFIHFLTRENSLRTRTKPNYYSKYTTPYLEPMGIEMNISIEYSNDDYSNRRQKQKYREIQKRYDY